MTVNVSPTSSLERDERLERHGERRPVDEHELLKDHHCSHCPAWSDQRTAAQRGDDRHLVECERSVHESISAATALLEAINELLLREAMIFIFVEYERSVQKFALNSASMNKPSK